MFFELQATPRQTAKIESQSAVEHCKPPEVPDLAAEFAAELQIRTGKSYKPFTLYDYQKRCSDDIDNSQITQIVKTRQTGMSQLVLMKFIKWSIESAGFVGLVFSKTLQDSYSLSKRCREMIVSHPEFELETDSLAELRIKGCGTILFRSPGNQNKADESGTGGRGVDSVSAIFFDEAAFLKNFELLWSSALPSTEMLGDDFKVIIVSTPNSKEDFYFNLLVEDNPIDILQLITEVREGEKAGYQSFVADNGWRKIIIHWHEHPIYSKNPNYLEDIHKKKKISWKQVRREHDLSFEDSDSSIFNAELIAAGAIGAYEDYRDSAAEYYAGLDVATCGDDFLALSILKFKGGNLSLVNVYRSKKKSMEVHLKQIFEDLQRYDVRAIAVETNGPGELYYQAIKRKFVHLSASRIKSSQETKNLGADRTEDLISAGCLVFPYGHYTDELQTLQRNGKKIEAAKGFHDDVYDSVDFAVDVAPVVIAANSVFGDIIIPVAAS